ncbi:MAG: hypothetical protein K6B72_05505 [Lachnospiraceae bacterium]|nr:hypothetical protein [Lachnospiraceae bacterium]
MVKTLLKNNTAECEAGDAAFKYMNSGSTAESEHASAPSHGPKIRESVSYGEEQGGLRDWFRRKFGRNKEEDIKISQPSFRGHRSLLPEDLGGAATISGDLDQFIDQAGAARGISGIQEMADSGELVAGADANLAGAKVSGQDAKGQRTRAFDGFKYRNGGTTEKAPVVERLARENLLRGMHRRTKQQLIGQIDADEDMAGKAARMKTDVGYGGVHEARLSEETNQMTGQLMDSVAEGLNTPMGGRYLQSMYDSVKGAKVFQEQGLDPMTYVMQVIMNNESLQFRNELMGDVTYTDRGDEQAAGRRQFTANSVSNMMIGPALDMRSQEEREAFFAKTPELKGLYEKYLEVKQKMSGQIDRY